ncbi:MAG: hypothetical protein OEW21_06945 [Betaproteobacteria bacterium]|nr:hypothetical protein [Betaproteobacteria bacterium]
MTDNLTGARADRAMPNFYGWDSYPAFVRARCNAIMEEKCADHCPGSGPIAAQALPHEACRHTRRKHD